jgi:hypothetical protein
MQASGERRALWLVLGVYVAVELVAACHHEPWFDELHSWNIARASATPAALISNMAYEGHPPVWYVLLWIASRFTHAVGGLHAVQLVAATGVAALVLFAAPFRPLYRVLLLCGYYCLFEYGVLCRNYAVGVFLLFSLCIIQRRALRSRPVLYYALLFALANVHFLFTLLAASLHVAVLDDGRRRGGLVRREVIRHAALGAGLVLIPLLFILPPRDSQLVPSFWFDLWTPRNLFWVLVAPLRALIPLPAGGAITSGTRRRCWRWGISICGPTSWPVAPACCWRSSSSWSPAARRDCFSRSASFSAWRPRSSSR